MAYCQVFLILSGHKCPAIFIIPGHFVRFELLIVMISPAIMSLCSSMVMVCEHHNIEIPILGVKEAMSAMFNLSLLSTCW